MKRKYIRKLALVMSISFLGACSENEAEPSPYEEVNTMEDVRIALEKDVYDPAGDTFILNTINESEDEISYGVAFSLEKERDGEWYVVEPNEEMAFIMIVHSLDPGEEAQEELSMEYYEPLETGDYRVVREIEGEVLTAEFAVE
ncbi:immunoglobulin-like domain-containing protein [Alkalibacterium subtropicum]